MLGSGTRFEFGSGPEGEDRQERGYTMQEGNPLTGRETLEDGEYRRSENGAKALVGGNGPHGRVLEGKTALQIRKGPGVGKSLDP